MKALILCGGTGTRLRPITYEIPKSLLPIHGRPVLEHIIDLLKKYEIKEIILAVGHLKEQIKNYFLDGEKFGLKIYYVEESMPLGTAGPLKLASNLLEETFIVSNGDELKNINIREMLKQHKKNNALITIALTKVDDPSAYGVARLRGKKIIEFVEKPKEKPKEKALSCFINAGFYIFEPEVLEYIKKSFCMLEKDVFPIVAKEGKLYGFKFSGQWFDVGTWQRYEEAIKKWKCIK